MCLLRICWVFIFAIVSMVSFTGLLVCCLNVVILYVLFYQISC